MDWLAAFASYEDAFIKDLRGLLNINSIRDEETIHAHAPFGKGCREALDYMLALGKRDGFVVKDIDGYAGVIEYGEGEESVGVLAHLDIVPLGDGWSKEPLAGVIEQGYLFARGALDDKGPAMAAYYALKMLKDHGIKTERKIMLILGCDEESGMSCMKYYAKHGEIPTLGFTPDADFPVIYGEKGGIIVHLNGQCTSSIVSMHAGERANVVIGKAEAIVKDFNDAYESLFTFYLKANNLHGYIEKMDTYTKVFIEGVSAHGAMPYNGVNAAMHLFNFIGTVMQDTFAKQSADLLSDWMGKALHIDYEGAYMGFLTMNVGVVDIEDGNAQITCDIRYPNDMEPETITENITKSLKECGYPLKADIQLKAKPLFVDPNSTLVTTLTQVYRKYSHDESSANVTIGGGTYAKMFDNFVAFGPEFPKREETPMFVGGPHQRDEGVCLNDLYTAIAIYCEAMQKLAEQE